MKFWKISPGKKAFYWKDFQNQKLFAIGWLHDLGDLDKIKDPDKIKRIAVDKGHSYRGRRSRIKQIIEFYNEASEGHIVVAYGEKTIKDIGVINSSYYYDDSQENRFHDGYTYVHRKGVKWLSLFEYPITVSGEILEELQKPSDTIHEIKSEQVKKKIVSKYLVRAGYNYVESGDGVALLVSEEQYEKELDEKEKEANLLSNDELEKKAKSADKQPDKIETHSYQYRRNSYVSAYAKRRANGVCDLCRNAAPFHTNNGPFLETHHIVSLTDGGEDSINNTVALCPNCHRKIHALNLHEEIKLLNKKARVRII